MKRYHVFSCLLAALAFTPLITACGTKESKQGEGSMQNEAESFLPEIEEPAVETPALPALPSAPSEEEATAVQYLCTTADGLNLRAGAGTQYASLGKAEKNILVKYAGKAGEWYETRYRGKTAYVHAGYAKIVELDKGTKKAEAVIEEGLKLLGTPYVYGATRFHDGKGNKLTGFTTEKFDCSSLMQYIFYKGAGVLLDTTTRTQILQGKAVDKIERGDLLFFTNASRRNKTGIERVGHVALYLGGNYILHTASDYAKIEQISSTRWSYFISARRML